MNQSASRPLEPSHRIEFASLVFCLVFPSLGVIQKYLGNLGLAAYVIMAPAILWFALQHFRLLAGPSDRKALYLVAMTLFFLVVIFAIVYPKANVHIPGRGSDADDALNLAVSELLHGSYPYYVRTYLDNPIAPMPGAILFAVPFVLLGTSAYQNLFWLGVFCFVLFRRTHSWRTTLAIFWMILIFCPVVIGQVVTGSDDPSNTIYVLAFMFITIDGASRADVQPWKKVLAAIVLGIALSSRANFLLVMPQLFAALSVKNGWRTALKYSALVIAVFAAVTLPFWIHDPTGFTPLSNQAHKVAEFQNVLPFASLIVPTSGGGIALVLAWTSIKRRAETWLRDCFIVQAFLVLCVVALAVFQTTALTLIETSYGVFFLFFGVLAFGLKMLESPMSRKKKSFFPFHQLNKLIGLVDEIDHRGSFCSNL